ncbi:hypothetical protein TOPH_02096 [Tolypocladium ophioglossoides CBS 100239]|uniref:Uncharacterized protein n=1 Tax=Tolypocladium ophioglossoides (strain CBS 100239) TaxID=1163406 RepID=A0A0L0NGB3_TOLOC|nr:hypothetical protein TOPH_02096 [Tolypocladium ophioglossoides CBS 100239]
MRLIVSYTSPPPERPATEAVSTSTCGWGHCAALCKAEARHSSPAAEVGAKQTLSDRADWRGFLANGWFQQLATRWP